MEQALCGNEAREAQEVRSGIQEARSAIAAVLFEIDDITLQVNPQIESDYAIKIGCWENELLQAQIAARRSRRRLALAQAQVNEGRGVDAAAIEGALAVEFEEWELQLKAMVETYAKALEQRAQTRPMSLAEQREFQSLHRKLVKRLHPDLHPGQPEEAARFFLVAQTAYKHGDIELLRSIAAATESFEASEAQGEEPWDIDGLFAEYELALARLRVVEKQLAELKGRNPYALGALLSDLEWVTGTVCSLKEKVGQQREAKRLYDERFARLAGGDACGR